MGEMIIITQRVIKISKFCHNLIVLTHSDLFFIYFLYEFYKYWLDLERIYCYSHLVKPIMRVNQTCSNMIRALIMLEQYPSDGLQPQMDISPALTWVDFCWVVCRACSQWGSQTSAVTAGRNPLRKLAESQDNHINLFYVLVIIFLF